jgi:penicillin-binding protein 2
MASRLIFGSRQVTEAQQSFSFTRRTILLGGAQAALGVVLAGRMAWLSIAENERYTLLAEDNRVQMVLIPPRRGWIVDRAGKPLAINRTEFRVDVIPDRLHDADRVIGELARLLSLSPENIAELREELSKAEGYQPVQVAANLDWERFAAVSVRLPDLPGVAPVRGFTRYYPSGAAVGHLLGYVGAASAKQYEEEHDPLLIAPGFKVGKEGFEKMEEQLLRGLPGARRNEVTARGRLVRQLTTKPETLGHTLPLTIDAGLQAYTARRLGRESGSVVVIDTLTGGILTLASMPCYDPNSFSDGISHAEWAMMAADERHPLINKTLNALYPPGSTYKPMVAMALLGAGVKPTDTIYCNGGYQLGNRFFRCLGRHGTVNLHRAIAKSCNSYFYAMGRRVGVDALAAMGHRMGFGEKFDLPVPSQSFGTVPDPAWKERRYKQQWSQSDTLNMAIGQGYVLVNPLQLAVMAARVASGRNIVPRLIAGRHPAPEPLPMPPEHFAAVRSGMWEVVNGDGTAGRSRLPLDGVQMGGKTGTAQVRRISGSQRGQSGAWKYRDHGLFVCFAPTDNPRYAASVVIEHGMGGSRAAAPVAKDVLTYLYDPEKAMKALTALEAGWGGDIETRMKAESEAWALAHDPVRQAALAAERAAAAAAEAAQNVAGNAANAVPDNMVEPD